MVYHMLVSINICYPLSVRTVNGPLDYILGIDKKTFSRDPAFRLHLPKILRTYVRPFLEPDYA